jgi:hypothetical protein
VSASQAQARAKTRHALLALAEQYGIKDAATIKTRQLLKVVESCVGKTPAQVAALQNKRHDQRVRRMMKNDGTSLSYDSHQFENHGRKEREEAAALAPLGEDITGMSVVAVANRHAVEPWAQDTAQVAAFLDEVFPAVRRDTHLQVHRRKGFFEMALWNQVIDLYFGKGWDAETVSQELNREGATAAHVEDTVQAIRRRRSGLAADGKPLKGGRGGLRAGAGRKRIKPSDSTQTTYTDPKQSQETETQP